MKASQFQWPFVIVLASLPIVSNIVEPKALGISGGGPPGRFHIAGGTALWALAYSVVIAVLYIGLMYVPSDRSEEVVPGMLRRWLAFWLDLVLSLYAVVPVIGLIPMFSEWNKTGVFAWNFVRTTRQPGDNFEIAVTTLLAIASIVAFYIFPLYRNRPSPGSCILGYQIAVVGEFPLTLSQSLFRTLLGLVAAATPYLVPVLDYNRQRGQFWLDRIFGTQAVKLS